MFPYIEVKGTHIEIGEAIGESLRAQIQKSLTVYFGQFRNKKQEPTLRVVDALATTAEKYFPQYLDELRGIAAGSGVSFYDLLIFSFEEELEPSEHCSSVGIKNGATQFLAHNEDWMLPLSLYVVKAKPKNKPAYVSVANAGQFPGTVAGLNEYGFAYAGNSISTRVNTRGLPKVYCLRSFLECRTIADAVKVVSQAPRSIGNNSVLVSGKEKRVATLEWSPTTYNLSEVKHGVVHTNHFVLPKLRGKQTEPTSYSSDKRYAFLQEKMIELPEPKLTDIQKLMRSHINKRTSVCRHTGWKTLTSVIADTTKRTLYVAAGTPCDHPYKAYAI